VLRAYIARKTNPKSTWARTLDVANKLRALSVVGFVVLGFLGAPLASADSTLAQLYHTGWTVRQGAPPDIMDMAQTTDGFMWFATRKGLFRFDGQSFDRYQPSSGDPLPGSEVLAVQPSADGGLWIGYGRVGVSFLKDGHNTNYGERAGFGLSSVENFAVDAQNGVWAVGPVLRRFDGKVWSTVSEEWGYPANTRLRQIFADSRGTLWIGTDKGLLYLRKGEHAFQSVKEVTWEVNSIAESPNGTLWLGSPKAPLRAFDPQVADLRKDIPPIETRNPSTFVARDGKLWMGDANHGLLRLEDPEKSAKDLQHFTAHDGLTSDECFMIRQDREGSVWVVTTKGVDQFRPTALVPLTRPASVDYPTTAVAGPGQVFIGSTVVEVPSGRLLAPRPLSVSEIYTIYRDPDDSLWFGGVQGLWKLINHRFVPNALPAKLPGGQRVQAIAKDHAGRLWVSISRDAVYRLSENGWSRMTQLQAAPDNLNTAITVDSRGRIWFTYAKADQVQLLDGDTLRTFSEKDGIDLGYTTTVGEIGGNIVIGGETGLEVLQGPHFRRLRLDNDATVSAVTGVLQQKNGDVWINQASGIIQIKAADIEHALSDPAFAMPFTLYDYLDGLEQLSSPPSPLPTIVDSGENILYFVMRTTVYFLDTAHLPHNTLHPAVIIRSLSDDAREYLNPIDAALPANTDKVTIRFTASSLLIPQRVQFRYRLEGIDKLWQQGNAQRLAVYSRLPPGQYVFHVAASNNDGVWNDEGASVRFSIPPTFVQTVAFKALCTVLAVALAWILYRIRLRQITAQIRRRLYERLEERARIARDLHDTFFQGVQGLLLRFNTASSLLNSDEPAARTILNDTLKQSDQVMLEGREIMLDLRSEASETDLGDALSVIGNALQETSPADFRVTVIGDPQPIHPIVFEEIHRFAREALSNAFRHAQAKSIEAELSYAPNEFRVRIRDDGIGIDAEVLRQGARAGHFGLPGMRERASKIGGHVDIWSRSGAGTEIELRVPGAAAYESRLKPSRLKWLSAMTKNGEDSIE
jgi:signal transduction histidine kinase/ligand-binding sensor domain-containing protein